MNKIKHSKYKNTGLLFELLIHQITVDTMKGDDSPSVGLVKKYFVNTELGKEYRLYESILKSQNLNETKASMIINEALENSKKLNKKSLKSLKYNLIKEVRENYDFDKFFTSKIKSYKQLASLYILLESVNSPLISDPEYITDNKITLLEHITRGELIVEEKDDVFKELDDDKDLRIITYKILLESFNKKYDGFNNDQKSVLKEFINSMDSSKGLRELYNNNVSKIKTILENEIPKTTDQSTVIKLNELNNLITEVSKNKNVINDDIVNLLQYYDLTEELKKSNI